MGSLDFWVPLSSLHTSTQVAGSSNPFLSRLLNRDTITRISYKSKSLDTGRVRGGGGEVNGGWLMHIEEFSRGTPLHSDLIFLQMMPTFFKT